jgi:hypothetical protein
MQSDFLKPTLNVSVIAIQLDRALIGIDRIGHLIITRLIQGAKVKPNFR